MHCHLYTVLGVHYLSIQICWLYIMYIDMYACISCTLSIHTMYIFLSVCSPYFALPLLLLCATHTVYATVDLYTDLCSVLSWCHGVFEYSVHTMTYFSLYIVHHSPVLIKILSLYYVYH